MIKQINPGVTVTPPIRFASIILQARALQFPPPIHMFENKQTTHHHWVHMEVGVKYDQRVQ